MLTVNPAGWVSSQTTLITRLLPHIRQFVRVRQVLARAGSFETGVNALLENRRIGIVHLDRRGQILAANDRALDILQREAGLSDGDGVLQAWAPEDQPRLAQLVAAALPVDAAVPVSGSMALRRPDGLLPLVAHVKPVSVPQPDYGGRHIAVLILLVEPGSPWRIDPNLVAEVLGLTPRESQVAARLAEGKSVEEMARDMGVTVDAIYWHLKQIYQKLVISRQADLIRVVLSVTGLG